MFVGFQRLDTNNQLKRKEKRSAFPFFLFDYSPMRSESSFKTIFL